MSNVEFGIWETPETANPYLDTIIAMIANDEKVGEGKTSATLIVKAEDALKTRNLVSKAANANNRTAKYRVKDAPVEDKGKPTGNVRIVWTLSPRHKARRGANKA